MLICSVAVQKGVISQIEHLGRSYAASDTSKYSVVSYGDIVYTKSPTGDFPYGIVKQSQLSLTHKNLPLAMFLEESDLGLSAWTGSTNTAQTDQMIIANLGVVIIRFKELEIIPVEADVTYRTDTDVITSVTVSTNSEKNPDNPAYVKFEIDGKTYTHNNIYIPEDGSQLAWVKWTTPTEEDEITIKVTSNCTVDINEITAEIVDLDLNPPPDPQANDRNDSFVLQAIPQNEQITSLTWGEWDAWWYEYWVDNGSYDEDGNWDSDWEDEGWYEFDWISYTATLSADMSIKPDDKAPTATSTQMKSGYGVNMEVKSDVRSNAPTSHYTGLQNVVAYFPEFEYETFWRLLERKNTGYRIEHEFKENIYSTYSRRSHFSPVWFPNGDYILYGTCIDAWTPAGMMSINLTDSVKIKGSLFDDWIVRPEI